MYFLQRIYHSLTFAVLGTTPIMLSVWFGAALNCLSKATKYSVFDISKEMAFTPLDPKVQWNGKTSIDGIGTNLGKTGASIVNQGFIIVFGTVATAAPILGILLLAMLATWIVSVKKAGKTYKELTSHL